jgi:hypothetical protein
MRLVVAVFTTLFGKRLDLFVVHNVSHIKAQLVGLCCDACFFDLFGQLGRGLNAFNGLVGHRPIFPVLKVEFERMPRIGANRNYNDCTPEKKQYLPPADSNNAPLSFFFGSGVAGRETVLFMLLHDESYFEKKGEKQN